ncbi:MAG: shikimate dehydrogenase [Magnetococcus sp. YQC-9]
MHQLAYTELGMHAYRYSPFHVRAEHLAEAVHGMRALGFEGFNATIPHKEQLVVLMDKLDPMAQAIGAVNTVAIDASGCLTGYNTDGYGFITNLRELFSESLQGMDILVLGAGGAARGVLAGLLQEGANRIALMNRTKERAEDLAERFDALYPGQPIRPLPWCNSLPACRLLINTTSLGMEVPGAPVPDLSHLPADAWVYDIVYAPAVTPLLAAARKRGLQIENGLGMLIHQGARAFEIWTGRTMPVPAVRRGLKKEKDVASLNHNQLENV